jgi:poly(A) polymerase
VIGRRFLLVNVFFGSKIIEVSTFRRTMDENGFTSDPKSLFYVRDNVFGTDEEDALRRDFTINALFYDPAERTVIDYVGGIEDLQMGKIKTIGSPEVRFKEDPIRIIRALKLQARLDFEIVPETRQAIQTCISYLKQSPPARVLLEIEKILRGGACLACFESMVQASIFSIIAPDIDQIWLKVDHPSHQVFKDILQSLDKLPVKNRNSLSEASLVSSILFPFITIPQKARQYGEIPGESYCYHKLIRLASNLSLSKKLLDKIIQILRVQYYLETKPEKSWEKDRKILHSDYFAEALDFLYVRLHQDKEKLEIYDFWQKQYLRHHR